MADGDSAEAINKRRLEKTQAESDFHAKLLGLKDDLGEMRDIVEDDEDNNENQEKKPVPLYPNRGSYQGRRESLQQ